MQHLRNLYSRFNEIFSGNENVEVKWCTKINRKCVTKPLLLPSKIEIKEIKQTGVKIYKRESTFTSEL